MVRILLAITAVCADDVREGSQRHEDHDDPDGEQSFHGTFPSMRPV